MSAGCLAGIVGRFDHAFGGFKHRDDLSASIDVVAQGDCINPCFKQTFVLTWHQSGAIGCVFSVHDQSINFLLFAHGFRMLQDC
jgi:hypothetical protein